MKVEIKDFIESRLKVFSLPVVGSVPFKLLPTQERLLGQLQSHNRNIIRTFRVSGISSLTAAYALYKMLDKRTSVYVTAPTTNNAEHVLKLVLDFLKCYGLDNPQTVKKVAHDHIVFQNGSIIRACSGESMLGVVCDLLIVEQAALISEDAFSTLEKGFLNQGEVIVSSAPIRASNGFSKLYTETLMGNSFKITDIHWYEDPRYNKDLVWKGKIGGEKVWVKEQHYTTESFMQKIMAGLKPTNLWYKDMKRIADKEMVKYEIDIKL